MNPPISKIGQTDLNLSVKLASRIREHHWGLITGRQELFSPHRETKSIFLRSVPDPTAKSDSDMFFEKGHMSQHVVYNEYVPEIDLVLSELSRFLIIEEWAASLINLPAGKTVYQHRDAYPSPANLHRIHLPIVTNEQCFFICGNVVANMKPDVFYEVRNLQYKHSVENRGSTDRIHLVIDVMGDCK